MTTLRKAVLGTLLGLCSVLPAWPAWAQAPIKVKSARLGFPSYAAVVLDVIKDQNFDQKNGLDLEVISYGTVPALYASIASGEVDTLGAGTHVLQKMRNEGVPIKVIGTYARHAGMVVVTGDPAIRTLTDLRGKTLAADIGSSEYQLLAIYARSQGLIMGKDVALVSAGPPMVRTQLSAKRVDAGMTWEPAATMTLRDNPQYRVVVDGETAVKAVLDPAGAAWQFIIAAREDFLRRQPQAVPRIIKMYQDGARFILTNPDDADRIVQRTVKMPEGVLRDAVKSKRLTLEVHPAWEQRSFISNMFKVAVDWGYLDKVPDDGAIYAP